MKFSEHWLRALCDPPIDTRTLADALTMGGLEVESVEAAAPAFAGVVVARIVAVAPHPGADRLRVCTVDAGGGAHLTIVCGAPNAAAGMLAPLAREGATLPDGTTIRRATMRGVDSEGMLCSARELGLADDASGLHALPADAVPGTALREALDLDDALITLKITPNRADCLSILGIARDTAALTGAPLVAPAWQPAQVTATATQRVLVEDAAACPRFASRVIEGVDARVPSPRWMQARLERSGIRPISAIVDVTNYVMLELGQPLHAYDRRHVDGDIVVRFARPGETLTLLNGEVLALAPDLLLVADSQKPLGLAGIMGGEHSGIGDDTRDVLLEGAFWLPDAIQGRMRRLGFTSDAGYRFERGVDFELGPVAVERATQLIVDLCGGRAGPLSDVKGTLPARAPVRVRPARVARLLGIAPDAATIARIFERLGFAFRRDGSDFVVTPPSYRFDLAIEEDFVEEIARIHGYDAIPATIGHHSQTILAASETRRAPAAVKDVLVARGWQEIVTFSFVAGDDERALDAAARPVAVENPIASHLDVMRTTLLPGLLRTLASNVGQGARRARIFEYGRTFRRDSAGYAQPMRIGGLAFGPAMPEQWGTPTRGVDYFDVKGAVAALFPRASVATPRAAHPALHPGRSAHVVVDDRAIGFIGELHPRLVRHFDLPAPAVVFEIDAAAAEAAAMPVAAAAARTPVVRRDLAVVVDESVPAADVLGAARSAAAPFVGAISLFDVYRGPSIGDGRKSLAILVLMQDTARTLTDAEIDAAMRDITRALVDRCGGTLR
ncbi:MAG TPA: phenylalanine--tRNA ligase subunit beta [Casimicrobiaceae bacterium]|nr:phenylalanine--tRNA ligase subunit beta [Casimicrobiaceae bacterium]